MRSLGQIATAECAPPLIKVLHTRSLLLRRQSDELRALAAAALALIPTDEAHQALLSVAQDRRKAVSAAARKAIQVRARRAARAQTGGTP